MDYDRFNPVKDFREEQEKQIEDINRIAKQYEPDFSEMFDSPPLEDIRETKETVERIEKEVNKMQEKPPISARLVAAIGLIGSVITIFVFISDVITGNIGIIDFLVGLFNQ